MGNGAAACISAGNQRAHWFVKAVGMPLGTSLDVVNTENERKLYTAATSVCLGIRWVPLQGRGCHAWLCPCSLGAFGICSLGWQRDVSGDEEHVGHV